MQSWGYLPYTVPVTHLVALSPDKTAPALSPLAFAQAKRWLRRRRFQLQEKLQRWEVQALRSDCVCLADLSQVEYSGSVLNFAQWVCPFPAQLSPSTRPKLSHELGGGTLDLPDSDRGNNLDGSLRAFPRSLPSFSLNF